MMFLLVLPFFAVGFVVGWFFGVMPPAPSPHKSKDILEAEEALAAAVEQCDRILNLERDAQTQASSRGRFVN